MGPPPLVKIRCTEDPMKKVPRVAIKALTFSHTIKTAFRIPIRQPPTIPARIATYQAASYSFSATTAKAAPKSSAIPTERSIPPIDTTKVIPSATIKRIAEPSKIFIWLPALRNTGFHKEKKTIHAAMTTKKLYRRNHLISIYLLLWPPQRRQLLRLGPLLYSQSKRHLHQLI